MNTTRKRRGILAGGVAAIAAAALALGSGLAASAAPVITQTTGNLHITKLSMPDGSPVASDGTVNNSLPAGATPISGVTFSVQQVTTVNGTALDLGTNAGWSAADTLSVNAAGVVTSTAGAVVLGTATTGETDTYGVPQLSGGGAAFQGLPIGVYLVKETITPAGVTPAAPFLVTIPITNPANQNEWLYDVYVYPKNSDVAITKTVSDPAKYQAGAAGALTTWTIKADVPRIEGATAGTWAAPTGFVIADAIDERLAVQTVTVQAVDSTGSPITDTALGGLVAADYDITPPTLPASAGTDVTVTFTAAGLTKLALLAATAGNQIEVTVGSLVVLTGSPATIGDGTIENTASVQVNGGTALVSTPATSYWGDAVFTKENAAGNDLAGATFQVYGSRTDATNATNPLLTSPVTSTGTGEVAIKGLPASNYLNGASLGTTYASYRVYWLVETVAPSNYELLADPIPFVLLSDGLGNYTINTVTVDGAGVATAVGSAFTNVVNVEKNAGFVLPLTGGTGTLWLTVGGVALLGLVLLFVIVRRRKEQAAE